MSDIYRNTPASACTNAECDLCVCASEAPIEALKSVAGVMRMVSSLLKNSEPSTRHDDLAHVLDLAANEMTLAIHCLEPGAAHLSRATNMKEFELDLLEAAESAFLPVRDLETKFATGEAGPDISGLLARTFDQAVEDLKTNIRAMLSAPNIQ